VVLWVAWDVHPALRVPEPHALRSVLDHHLHLLLERYRREIARATGEIEAVAMALRRLEDGSYARCETCGDALDEARIARLATACRACEWPRSSGVSVRLSRDSSPGIER
jgi:hypothetical protein